MPAAQYAADAAEKRPSGERSIPKRAKDPERPKRPPTPFFSFLAHYRTDAPAGKPTEIAKAASVQWKSLAAADRQRWEKPYEVAKRDYDARYKEYVDSGKKDAWSRDPLKPKRPLSGFMRFAAEVRPKYAHMKVTEQSKEMGKAWKGLTPEARSVYDEAYKADKVAFDKKMEEYKSSGQEDAWLKKVGLDKAQKKAKTASGVALKEKMAKTKLKLKAAAANRKQKAAAAKLKLKAAAAKAKLKEAMVKKAAQEKEAKTRLKQGVKKAKEALKKKMTAAQVAKDKVVLAKTKDMKAKAKEAAAKAKAAQTIAEKQLKEAMKKLAVAMKPTKAVTKK